MGIKCGQPARRDIVRQGLTRVSTVIAFVAAAMTLGSPKADGQVSSRVYTERYSHQETARDVTWRGAPAPEPYAPAEDQRWREPNRPEPAQQVRSHTVQAGETLFRIAKRYGVSVEALQRANGIADPTTLRIGQQLAIPSADKAAQPAREPRWNSAVPERPANQPRRHSSQPRTPAEPPRPDQRPGGFRQEPARDRGAPSLSGLRQLAETMAEPAGRGHVSEIPAGYTFFAQLVGADLKIPEIMRSWLEGQTRPRRVSAGLDLDIIYGRGPEANPERFYLPYIRTGPRLSNAGKRYALSQNMPPAGHVFVVQLQSALVELHNRAVDMLITRHLASEKSRYCEDDCSNAELARALPRAKRLLLFRDARETVIHYYHRIIVEDLLPRLIGEERAKDIIANGRDVFFPSGFREGDDIKQPFIPYEFALAAHQFTASQIRSSYQLRGGSRARPFNPVLLVANHPRREKIQRGELADWRYFVDVLPEPPQGFNRSALIDRYVAAVRGGWHNNRRMQGTAEAILIAGARAGLPDGTAVAEEVLPDLRKRGVLYLWEPRKGGPDDPGALWQRYVVPPDRPTQNLLQGKTPLWYYILQEARAIGGPTRFGADTQAYATASDEQARYATAQESISDSGRAVAGGHTLGPVGGTIFGEVLIGLAEHYALKTGKGLGFRPPIGASAYGERGRFTLTRVRAESGDLGERYLLRNLLIDAGAAVELQ